MCGIALVPKKELCVVLENQKARGLDSVGIIDFQSGEVITGHKENLAEYMNFIVTHIEDNDDLCFMHNRKASVGDISLDNSHPFVGNKFILAQNGTSRDLMIDYGAVYEKETDSETLLCLLEDTCNTLEECIDYLDTIESILGVIIISHKKRTLIYSDATRGTHVSITEYVNDKDEVIESRIKSLTSLKEKSTLEYKNGFYMIIENASGKILKEWNYDDSYNSSIWRSLTIDGTKGDKKTRVTKKNLDSIASGSHFKNNKNNKHNNYNNNSNALVVNSSKKNGIKETNKFWRNSLPEKRKVGEWPELTRSLTIVANSYKLTDLITVDDVYDLLCEYGIWGNLSETSKQILSEQAYNIVEDRESHLLMYAIADEEIWNAVQIKSQYSTYLDYIFMVPIRYLIGIQVTASIVADLNLVRHTRILNQLSLEEVLHYFKALHYFGDELIDRQYEGEFNKVRGHSLTLETYLFFKAGRSPQSDQNKVFIIPGKFEHIVKEVQGFVLAGFALGFTAGQLNIEKTVYNNLTAKSY